MTATTREQLHTAVGAVLEAAPAQALNELFKNVWFTEEYLCCYDGRLALRHDLSTGGRGGVPARALYAWLSACKGKEVAIENEAGEMKFKCGRSRLTLPRFTLDTMVFDWGTVDLDAVAWDDDQVTEAGAFCAKAMSDLAAKVDYSGVIIVGREAGDCAVSTTGNTARLARVKNWRDHDVNCHFPYRFAGLFPTMFQSGYDAHRRHIARLNNGSLAVVTPLECAHRGADIIRLFDDKGVEFSAPKKFSEMVDRVTAIHRGVEDDQKTVVLEGAKGRLRLSTSTTVGAGTDTVKLDDVPDFRVKVNAASLKLAAGEHGVKKLHVHDGSRFYVDCTLGSTVMQAIMEE